MASGVAKEIKRALMGRTFPLEDGRLAVLSEEEYLIPTGVSDGAASVLLLGVGSKSVYLKAAGKQGSALKDAREAMLHVGRELVLREQEDTVACIRRYRITRPVVLTFWFSEDVPILTAWTGRGIFSFISRSIAIRSFVKHMPKGLSLAPKEQKAEKAGSSDGGNKNGKGDRK